MLDVNQIRDILPHRYPMLMVDRIVEMSDTHIVGIKNVTANEPFFEGHFPDFPVMPGVLIAEAMAQVGGILVLNTVPERHEKLVFFASIDECKFRRPVVPGDQLRIELEVVKRRATICKMKGKALVDGQVAAEGQMMCQIVDKAAYRSGSSPAGQ